MCKSVTFPWHWRSVPAGGRTARKLLGTAGSLRHVAVPCALLLVLIWVTGCRTPLTRAARMGDIATVQTLLGQPGTDVNATDGLGETALHVAALRNNAELAKALLKNGADVNTGTTSRMGGVYPGGTPLHAAAGKGHNAMVELLLAAGAEVNARDNFGDTPLCDAIGGRHRDTVRLLLDAGAEIVTNTRGQKVIQLAEKKNSTSIAIMLREAEKSKASTPSTQLVTARDRAVAASGTMPSRFVPRPPPGHRPPLLAIWQLTPMVGISAEEAESLTETLRAELLQNGWFKIVARGEMKKVMQEQEIALSVACDTTSCAAEYGQMLSVESIVVGSVGRMGTMNQVVVKLIDVSSAEVRQVGQAQQQGGQELLLDLVKQAAADLVRQGMDR